MFLALYAARLLKGYCLGVSIPLIQIYLAETTQPDQRGVFLSASALSVSIGILLCHLLGTFIFWRTASWISSLLPVLSVLICLCVKESPTWLLQKGKFKEAEESYKWFRGDTEEAMKGFNDLLNLQQISNETTENVSKFKLMKKENFYKPFLILNFFFFIQQFSGVNAVTFYSVKILKNILTTMDEYFSTMIIDVVRLASSIFSIFLLKRYGSRKISLISVIGTSLSLFLLAICLGSADTDIIDDVINNSTEYLNRTNDMATESTSAEPVGIMSYILRYLPLFFMILYITLVTIGLVPLPWVLTGEIFGKEMRGIGSGVSTSFAFCCFFLVIKLSPDFFDTFHDYGTFGFFGVITAIGSFVLWKYLPETKDKTLEEIQLFFSKKS